jgi:hypothetical protein
MGVHCGREMASSLHRPPDLRPVYVELRLLDTAATSADRRLARDEMTQNDIALALRQVARDPDAPLSAGEVMILGGKRLVDWSFAGGRFPRYQLTEDGRAWLATYEAEDAH